MTTLLGFPMCLTQFSLIQLFFSALQVTSDEQNVVLVYPLTEISKGFDRLISLGVCFIGAIFIPICTFFTLVDIS